MRYSIETSSAPVSPVLDVYDSNDEIVVTGVTEPQATQLVKYLESRNKSIKDFALGLVS
jgi:hypothetical protein